MNWPRRDILEKYQDFLELSLKQFVKQSSSITPGQIRCGVLKNQLLMLLVAKSASYFSYQNRVMQVQI